jgi:hypothetical protein
MAEPQRHIPPSTPEGESLRELAQQYIDAAGGDWEKAAEALERALVEDVNLFERFVQPLIRSAVWLAIRQQGASKRRKFRAPTPDQDGRVTQAALDAVAGDNWLEYPLAKGLKLGEATRADLMNESLWHRTLAETNARKGRWLKAIGDSLQNDNQRVRNVLDSDAIAKLAGKHGVNTDDPIHPSDIKD